MCVYYNMKMMMWALLYAFKPLRFLYYMSPGFLGYCPQDFSSINENYFYVYYLSSLIFFFENCTANFFRILYASISVAFSFFLRIIHVSQYHLVLLQCYIILFELYVFVSFLLELDAPAHLLFCIVLVLICSFMSHRSVTLTSSSS